MGVWCNLLVDVNMGASVAYRELGGRFLLPFFSLHCTEIVGKRDPFIQAVEYCGIAALGFGYIRIGLRRLH